MLPKKWMIPIFKISPKQAMILSILVRRVENLDTAAIIRSEEYLRNNYINYIGVGIGSVPGRIVGLGKRDINPSFEEITIEQLFEYLQNLKIK